jgi:BlaI family transcriptional regulator, penicillinase repressor
MSTEKKRARGASRTRKDLPQISEAEWVVMKVICEKNQATANQVVETLESQVHWKPKTIHTLLARLSRKKALGFDKQGREYVFRSLVRTEDYVHAASRSFLRRFFDGEIAPFLACFLERERLSPDEIDELKQILDSKKP